MFSLSKYTSHFMSKAEQSMTENSINNVSESEKTTLSEVLTEGGLDGLVDKSRTKLKQSTNRKHSDNKI